MFTYTRNSKYQAYLEAMGYKVTSSISRCNRKGYSSFTKEGTTPEGFTQVLTLVSEHSSARNDHDFSSNSYYEYLNIPEGATVDLEALSWDLFNKFELVCGPLRSMLWADIRRINYLNKDYFDDYKIKPEWFEGLIDGIPHYRDNYFSNKNLVTVDQLIAEAKADAAAHQARFQKRDRLEAWANANFDVPTGASMTADVSIGGDISWYSVSCDNGYGHGDTPQEAIDAYYISKAENIAEKKAKLKELEKQLASYPTSKDILYELRSMHLPYADGMRHLASNTGWSVDTLWDIFKGKYKNELPWEAQCLQQRIEDLKKELNQ